MATEEVTNEKMFWALIVEPGKKYQQDVADSFHVSNAAVKITKGFLDSAAKNVPSVVSVFASDDSGEEYLLCNLSWPHALNHSLDLNFVSGEHVSFRIEAFGSTEAKALSVHLTGYLVPAADDDDNDSEFDPEMFPVNGQLSDAVGKQLKQRITEVESDDDDDNESGDDEDEEESSPEVTKKRKANTDAREILNAKRVKGEGKAVASKAKTNGGAAHDDDDEDDDDEDDSDDDHLDDDDDDDLDDGEEDDDDDDDDDDMDGDEDVVEVVPVKKVKKVTEVSTKPAGDAATKANKKAAADKSESKENRTPNKSDNKENKAQNGNTPTPKKTPKRVIKGGIIVEDLVVGTGGECCKGKQVGVFYEGRLKSNDKTFDSQLSGKPMKFKLGGGQVIKGWDLGVEGMKVGGKRRLTVPPKMAYGAAGAGNDIPPNATLVFDIEAKSVN